ncbi:MAG: hypothetical protein AB1776_00030 [Bacillota bacterium]
MQLEPGERAVLGYFATDIDAAQAAEALRVAGFTTVETDRISRFGVSLDPEQNYAVGGRGASLAALTIYGEGGEDVGPDSRVLLAADPSASGMAAKDYGVAGGRAFLVTVVTSDERAGEAAAIIKNYGGEV